MKRVIILTVFVLLLAALPARQVPEQEPLPREIVRCDAYDAALFASHIRSAVPRAENRAAEAAIVPHYAPALQLAADLLASLETPPDTVILLAPNHSGQGIPIQICGCDYVWQDGALSGDPSLAETLARQCESQTCSDAAQTDWAASVLAPYLAYFFPDAAVVTVYLSRAAELASLRALSDALNSIRADKSIFLLGSVDFSHDQAPESARICDAKVDALLQNGEIRELLTLDNSYLDSPETCAVLSCYAEALGCKISAVDDRFEIFVQNGQPTAGSYHSYVFKK